MHWEPTHTCVNVHRWIFEHWAFSHPSSEGSLEQWSAVPSGGQGDRGSSPSAHLIPGQGHEQESDLLCVVSLGLFDLHWCPSTHVCCLSHVWWTSRQCFIMEYTRTSSPITIQVANKYVIWFHYALSLMSSDVALSTQTSTCLVYSSSSMCAAQCF